MNPFDRVHRTFAFKRILGSVEKAWGRFLNEAYLRRTYLRGRLQSFASERGKMAPESSVLFWIREKAAP